MAPAGEMEVEAKFLVLDRASVRSIVLGESVAGVVAVGPARRLRLVDTYVDAIDGRLREAGWAARIRVVGDIATIELKETVAAGERGVQRRRELSGTAIQDTSVEAWPPSAARRRLMQLLKGAALIEVLVMRQSRLVREFGGTDGVVELSLDRVDVVDGRTARSRLDLIEIEHRSGPERALQQVIDDFRARSVLLPTTATKLGWASSIRALGADADGLPTIEANRAPVEGGEPSSEAGRRILHDQLARLLDRHRAFEAQPGVEEVRRMRVATRRLRATWRTFGDLYEGSGPDRVRRRLRSLAGALSAVRDLDVLLGRLDAFAESAASAASAADGSPLESFRASVAARRERALAGLRRDLDAHRYRTWLASFGEFVVTPGRAVVPVAPPEPRLVREQVGGWIWLGFERLVGWESMVDRADAPTLHQLRLEVKRLRDVVQVAAPVAGDSAAPILAALVNLQDVLGAVNDAMVSAAEARRWLTASPAPGPDAAMSPIETFARAQEAELARQARRAPAALRLVTSAASRRRVARFIGSF